MNGVFTNPQFFLRTLYGICIFVQITTDPVCCCTDAYQFYQKIIKGEKATAFQAVGSILKHVALEDIVFIYVLMAC